MFLALAQPILGHTMAQSTTELLALIGPFAILFGLGTVLVIGPVLRAEGERYRIPPATTATTDTASAGPDLPAPDHSGDTTAA